VSQALDAAAPGDIISIRTGSYIIQSGRDIGVRSIVRAENGPVKIAGSPTKIPIEVLSGPGRVQAACQKLSSTPPIVVHDVPQAPVTIGTFDGQSGIFTYDPSVLIRSHKETQEIQEGQKPKTIVITVIDDHHIITTSEVVTLAVNLVNNPAPVAFVFGTKTVVALPNASSVSMMGVFSGDQNFSLSSGVVSTENIPLNLLIEHSGAAARDLSLTTGCVVIPALPLAIAYQPPVVSGKGAFKISESQGVAVHGISVTSMTGGNEGTIDAPGITAHALHGLSDTLQAAGSAIGEHPGGEHTGGELGVSGSIIAFIADLLDALAPPGGGVEAPKMEVDNEHTVRIVSSVSNTFFSQPSLGMGAGDGIVYLHNATFAVINQDGHVTLSPLGYDGTTPTLVPAASLMPNAAQPASLDPDSRSGLLALDPVASGNPSGVTDPSRYSDVGEFVQPFSIEQGFSISYTVETSATKTYTTRSTSNDAILRIDLGPSQSQGRTVTAAMDATGPFHFEVYYDGLFGTFAYVDLSHQAPSNAANALSGSLASDAGAPLPHKPVTLLQNGHRITTFTDVNGRYLFKSPSLKTGPAELLLPPEMSGPTRLQIAIPPAS
jgi:hypothetical protein